MKYLTIIVTITCVTVAFIILGSESSQLSCIQMPTLSRGTDQSVAQKTAAELEELPGQANIEIEFKNIVNERFDSISEEDKALYLFLTAIECYLNSGDVGERIALEMTQLVRARWGAKHGFSGSSEQLALIEMREIKKSKHSEEIVRLFAKVGINSPL